jgi:hypothetical protein
MIAGSPDLPASRDGAYGGASLSIRPWIEVPTRAPVQRHATTRSDLAKLFCLLHASPTCQEGKQFMVILCGLQSTQRAHCEGQVSHPSGGGTARRTAGCFIPQQA